MTGLDKPANISRYIDTKEVDIKTIITAKKDIELADCLKAVGNPHRLQILRMLQDGERCVCEIHGLLCLPQNLASHHLKALREAGLVRTRRNGRNIIYSLNPERFKIVSGMLNEMMKGDR